MIYSQENTKYIFADYDSVMRPYPSYGLLGTAQKAVADRLDVFGSLSWPIKDEVVQRPDGSVAFSYYFPKILAAGLDWNAFGIKVPQDSCVEHHITVGLDTPLSHRFGLLIVPIVAFRIRVTVSENSGFNAGVGYSGDFQRRGALFIPLGFSYRL